MMNRMNKIQYESMLSDGSKLRVWNNRVYLIVPSNFDYSTKKYEAVSTPIHKLKHESKLSYNNRMIGVAKFRADKIRSMINDSSYMKSVKSESSAVAALLSKANSAITAINAAYNDWMLLDDKERASESISRIQMHIGILDRFENACNKIIRFDSIKDIVMHHDISYNITNKVTQDERGIIQIKLNGVVLSYDKTSANHIKNAMAIVGKVIQNQIKYA